MKKKDKLWEGKNSISIDREKVSRFLKRLTFLKISRKFDDCLPEMGILEKYPLMINSIKVFSEKNNFFLDEFYLKKNNICFLVKDISPQEKPLPEEIFRLNPYKQKYWKKFVQSHGESYF